VRFSHLDRIHLSCLGQFKPKKQHNYCERGPAIKICVAYDTQHSRFANGRALSQPLSDLTSNPRLILIGDPRDHQYDRDDYAIGLYDYAVGLSRTLRGLAALHLPSLVRTRCA
jgi:hypothetical protein